MDIRIAQRFSRGVRPSAIPLTVAMVIAGAPMADAVSLDAQIPSPGLVGLAECAGADPGCATASSFTAPSPVSVPIGSTTPILAAEITFGATLGHSGDLTVAPSSRRPRQSSRQPITAMPEPVGPDQPIPAEAITPGSLPPAAPWPAPPTSPQTTSAPPKPGPLGPDPTAEGSWAADSALPSSTQPAPMPGDSIAERSSATAVPPAANATLSPWARSETNEAAPAPQQTSEPSSASIRRPTAKATEANRSAERFVAAQGPTSARQDHPWTPTPSADPATTSTPSATRSEPWAERPDQVRGLPNSQTTDNADRMASRDPRSSIGTNDTSADPGESEPISPTSTQRSAAPTSPNNATASFTPWQIRKSSPELPSSALETARADGSAPGWQPPEALLPTRSPSDSPGSLAPSSSSTRSAPDPLPTTPGEPRREHQGGVMVVIPAGGDRDVTVYVNDEQSALPSSSSALPRIGDTDKGTTGNPGPTKHDQPVPNDDVTIMVRRNGSDATEAATHSATSPVRPKTPTTTPQRKDPSSSEPAAPSASIPDDTTGAVTPFPTTATAPETPTSSKAPTTSKTPATSEAPTSKASVQTPSALGPTAARPRPTPSRDLPSTPWVQPVSPSGLETVEPRTSTNDPRPSPTESDARSKVPMWTSTQTPSFSAPTSSTTTLPDAPASSPSSNPASSSNVPDPTMSAEPSGGTAVPSSTTDQPTEPHPRPANRTDVHRALNGPVASRPAPSDAAADVPSSHQTLRLSAPLPWASGQVTQSDRFVQARSAARAAGDSTHLVQVNLAGRSWAELSQKNPVFRQAEATAARVVYDVPLEVGGTSTAETAAGVNDAQWRAFGSVLATSKRTNVVRLRVPAQGDSDDAKLAFRRAAQLVRSHNERIRIEWAAPVGQSPRSAGARWPGPDVVDIVGLDIPSSGTWTQLLAGDGGLLDWADWASRSGKQVALHWQLGKDTDAAWVRNVSSWIQVLAAQRRMSYETVRQTEKPDPSALAVYRALW